MSPRRPDSAPRPDDDEFEQLSPGPATHPHSLHGHGDSPQSPGSSKSSGTSRQPAKPGMSAKAKALSYLARREHSQLELTRKLSAKGYSEDEIAQALAWVREHQFQSDTRFIRSVVRRKAPNLGDRAIAHELAQHGLSGSGKANSLVCDVDDSDEVVLDERQRAFDWLTRRYSAAWAHALAIEDPSLRRLSQQQVKAKALRGLGARGFEAGNASKAWRDFTEACEPEA